MTVPFPKSTRARGVMAGITLMLGVGGAALPALAGKFPDSGGHNERDVVTGYLCMTPACDVLRHPTANCICIKQNPGEYKLNRLKLKCLAKQHGEWVACPVGQRYGN